MFLRHQVKGILLYKTCLEINFTNNNLEVTNEFDFLMLHANRNEIYFFGKDSDNPSNRNINVK